MTAMPRELVRKRPAEVVPNRPRPDLGTRVLLRLIALAFLAGAAFMMWCAATGNRP